MSRPTAGTLTGAGFTQVAGTTKYTKNQGTTAVALADIGNTLAGTGVEAVTVAGGQAAISSADFATSISTHAGTGAHVGGTPPSVDSGRNLQYYGITL
jgi:hypothetical protein